MHSSVRRWLRLEGLAVLVLATYLYAQADGRWMTFALLFLAPDLSFAGYLAGPRAGAVIYNIAHSYIGPVLLAGAALTGAGGLTLALIWAAHIGMDRAVGYGLKYPSAFGDTHLGRVGRK